MHKMLRSWRAIFFSPRIGFAAAIIAIGLFKLWLVSGEEIIGSATQYDALWFVRSARHWYWGTPYSWTAFVRPGVYPLWIAVVHMLHVPLRLAIELLQIGGAFVLVIGLRNLGLNRWISSVSFAAICLHPAGFQLDDYTMSDTLYAALLWYVLGGLLLILSAGTRRMWIAIATGIAIGILWNTREEGLLLIGIIAVWLAILLVRENATADSRHKTVGRAAKMAVTTCAMAAFVITGFYTVNYFVFKSFARSELTARSFQSLFHSLLRIKPEEPKRYVPITTDTLLRAFKVSPTFAKLQAQFDSPLGESWRVETFHRVGVPHEIGVGWIVWATRQAASAAGMFETPKTSQQFFKNAAREINRACDDGRLPTRFAMDGFLDPFAQSEGVAGLPKSAARIGARFFGRWPVISIDDNKILTAPEASLYDDMTFRRSPGVPPRENAAFFLENLIGRYHFVAIILLHLLAVAAIALLWIFRHSVVQLSGYASAIGLLASAVFLRGGLFVWLDAIAFDATDDRFLFPILPLWTVVLVLIVGCSVEAMQKPADASKNS